LTRPSTPQPAGRQAGRTGQLAAELASRSAQLRQELASKRSSLLLLAGDSHADREPDAPFEVTLWRALAVFRVATLIYAILLTAHNFQHYRHPYAAWVVIAVMSAWTLAAVTAYAFPRLRTWPLITIDIVVTGACVLSSRWIVAPELLGQGMPTLTITWMACPVVATAIAFPRWRGPVVAVIMGACDLIARAVVNQVTVTGTVIMVIAAVAVAHIAFLANQAQARLRVVAEIEAATRERERLARRIHDSVLQVLTLVQRRGAELGGEAGELGRLAGEQEAELRLLLSPTEDRPSGMTDLRELIGQQAGVTLSAPATGVWLPAHAATELAAAVSAAVKNVHQHCPAEVSVWILVEDEPEAITVTVRDDGPGIPAGRLAEAVAHGRLGIAQSIRGRLADLGGTASITTGPRQGTEVELTLPRQRPF
jgi:signal transduction histidine kinase